MATQAYTPTPGGPEGISVHMVNGQVHHFSNQEVSLIVFDGTLPASADPTPADPDPVFVGDADSQT